MAEILIKAIDFVNPDPIKNVRGAYKRGDPVVIKPDGWTWGDLETLPPKYGGKFVRIRIMKNDGSVLTPTELEDIVKTRWDVSIVAAEQEIDPETLQPRNLRRRLLRFTLDLLTAAQRNTLNNVGCLGFAELGQAIVTLNAIRTRIQNKLTQESL